MGEIIVAILHIYEARDISYYFVLTKTLNLSNMILYWNISTNIKPEKNIKPIWDNDTHTLQIR